MVSFRQTRYKSAMHERHSERQGSGILQHAHDNDGHVGTQDQEGAAQWQCETVALSHDGSVASARRMAAHDDGHQRRPRPHSRRPIARRRLRRNRFVFMPFTAQHTPAILPSRLNPKASTRHPTFPYASPRDFTLETKFTANGTLKWLNLRRLRDFIELLR